MDGMLLLLGLLTATLLFVFAPSFMGWGYRPLSMGSQEEPEALLATRRDLLLRQIKELQSDTAAGLVEKAASEKTEQALEQELVTLLDQLDGLSNGHGPSVSHKRGKGPVLVSVLLMVVMGVGATLLYGVYGTPNWKELTAQSQPPQQNPKQAEIAAMVENFANKLLNSEEESLDEWMKLARSFLVLGKPMEALAAYNYILGRDPAHLEAFVALAQVEMETTDPALWKLGVGRFEALLTIDPDMPQALWMTGLAAAKAGEKVKALKRLNHLLEIMPEAEPNRAMVEQAIAQVEENK